MGLVQRERLLRSKQSIRHLEPPSQGTAARVVTNIITRPITQWEGSKIAPFDSYTYFPVPKNEENSDKLWKIYEYEKLLFDPNPPM